MDAHRDQRGGQPDGGVVSGKAGGLAQQQANALPEGVGGGAGHGDGYEKIVAPYGGARLKIRE